MAEASQGGQTWLREGLTSGTQGQLNPLRDYSYQEQTGGSRGMRRCTFGPLSRLMHPKE